MNSFSHFSIKGLLLALLITLSACGPSPEPIVEDEWYVSVSGNDDNDCRTLATACLSISETINKAAAGDTIFIGTGTFTGAFEGTSVGLTATVYVGKPIKLIGNGPGLTILDGEGARTVVHIRAEGDVFIRYLTITNGGESDTDPNSGGGVAITDPDSNVLIMDTHITNNFFESGADGGAGVRNYGRLEMYDVVITDNTLGREGTVYSYIGNTGGGISNGGEMVIARADISRNSSPGDGGGIANLGTARLFDVTIDSNSAAGDALNRGGGIYNQGYMEVSGSTISNNTGGGVFTSGYFYRDEDETINMKIINSTISGNDGYGLLFGGVTFLDFATITDNVIGLVANGCICDVKLYITNSIVTQNRSYDTTDQVSGYLSEAADGRSGTTLWFNYHTFFGMWNHLNYDRYDAPLIGALADNGGPTFTHALLPGSSALDKVDSENCLSFDQRGEARWETDTCDVGAYEFSVLDGAERTSLEITETVEFVTVPPIPNASIPTINTDTLCWTGPGKQYSVVSTVTQGAEVDLLGSGEIKGWWVIDNPRYPGVACWLPEDKLDVDPSLDLSTLKLFPVPQLPTATFTPPPPPVAPQAPSGLAAAELKCNTTNGYIVKLTWKDNANNETGYRVYHNGGLIATLGANATQFTSGDLGTGAAQSFYVQAFNNAGTAKSNTALEDGCIY